MAMTPRGRALGMKYLSSVCLMALLVLGAYRIADSCGGGWSPHFFIPYSPGEKNLLAQMTAVKMDEQYALHDDKDDSYLRIYEETYAQDFNPVISRDIRQSYEWLAQGNIKAALSKDRALLTRLRNYVQLNHMRSKKLVVFLNTTEERVLLAQQGLPSALTQRLVALLQKIDEGPYEEARQKITSLGATLPKNRQFYTRWYGFLLKRLYEKPTNEDDYPDPTTAIQRHPDLKSTESMRSSLAMRYLRQFKFEDAQRMAELLRDEKLHQKIKDVKAHYAVDSDAGLYATGAWFYHGDAAIFTSPTTSYRYEKAKSLKDLQDGYLGQLNKYLVARKMFAALIQKYPDSSLIDKAHYSLALCDIYVWSHHSFYHAFRKELWDDAVRNFLAVYRKTPKSALADNALYWAGYFSEAESEKQKYWDLIRKEYPDGDVLRRGLPRPEHKPK